MQNRFFSKLFITLIACGLTGCMTIRVKAINPHPNIAIMPSNSSLSLKFNDSILDTFVVKKFGGQFNIAEWKKSLENGFTNAFSDSHRLETNGDYQIFIKEASLDFPSQKNHGNTYIINSSEHIHVDSIKSIFVTLRYNALLLDKSGNILDLAAGTIMSNEIGDPWDTENRVGEVISRFYEEIAREFFGKNSHKKK